ncbi:hypothetical protein R3P38DRAFT_3175791 [Favolaschia claudopus]|uniref:Uncharacterized protein n=1 Tax=Favolaschia claudopus TaxID=2862362 RepID=A0AAW0D646_9AGAR
MSNRNLQMQPPTMAQELFFLDYNHLIGLTILYFDHLVTLGMILHLLYIRCTSHRLFLSGTEIELLWRRRVSFSAYWFYINRYLGLFSGLAVSALPFDCRNYSFFREVVLVVTQTIAGVIMIIRVYALYGRDRRVLWAMLGVGFGVIGISVFSVTQQHASYSKMVGGCHYDLSQGTSLRLAGSWEGLFVFDTFIFMLTVYNAFRTWRRVAPTLNLYTLVVRDGAAYFGIMALANLANIATFYFTGPLLPGSLATFANCISITMISRLILNLHKHAFHGLTSNPSTALRNNDLTLGSGANISFTTSFSEPENQAGTPMRVGSTQEDEDDNGADGWDRSQSRHT